MAMAISSSSKNFIMFDHHKTFPMGLGLGLGFPTNPINISLKSFTFFPNSPKHPHQPPNITETHASNSHDNHQPPHFNFFQKVASLALDTLEKPLLSNVNLPKTSDPRVQIAGNYAPVPEQPVHHSLPITGTIPNCINGVYLRNGANPLFEPVAGHHLFDGDGMVHAVTIKEGTASYGCRFTQTNRLIQEQKHGRPVFPKSIGELHGHTGIARLLLFFIRGIFGLIDNNHGTGVANAGLVFFNGHLLAISEDDLPYHLHITSCGDLITAGRYNFDDQINSSMIPHPKIDPDSGELFTLSYNILHKPYLKYFRFSKEGKKLSDVEILVKNPTMIHDFAITENFVVIPDQKMVFNLHEMVKGGSPVTYDKNKKSRFGILPKNAAFSSEIIWVNSEDSFCFHFWNAWEDSNSDSDEIIMIGSCMTPPDSIFNECNNDVEDFKVVLSEIRLDLKTKKTTCREIITGLNLEAGTVNRNFLGRKTRYVYLAITDPWPKVSGFAKVDLEKGEVKKYVYGDGRFGGEPYFVEREGGGFLEREDDGYVMVFVHDEKKWKSELLIVNAMDLELEACVEMPSRVPYGFHGTFVHAKDLASQA